MINIENPTNSRVLGSVIEFVIADKQFIFWKIVKSSNSLQDFFNNPQFEFIIKDICELRGISMNDFMNHINQIIVLNDNQEKTHKSKFKHLRGQHDQRDHAWNRGMGGGGGGVELGSNQMGPVPTMQWYQKRRTEFSEMVRNGEMTRTDMRNQLRELRGMIPGPSRREQASIVLASQRNSPINQTQASQPNNPTPSGAPSPVSSQQSMTSRQRLQEIKQMRQDVHKSQIDAIGRMQNAINQITTTDTYKSLLGIKPSIIIQKLLYDYTNAVALGKYIYQMQQSGQMQIPSTITKDMLGANNPYMIDIAAVRSIALKNVNLLNSALSQDNSNFAFNANNALLDIYNPSNSPTYAADLQMAYSVIEPFLDFVSTAQDVVEKTNDHLIEMSRRFGEKSPDINTLQIAKNKATNEKIIIDRKIHKAYARDQVIVDLMKEYSDEYKKREQLIVDATSASNKAQSDFLKIKQYENANGEKVRQKLVSQGVLTDAESTYNPNDPFSNMHPLVKQELSKQLGYMILVTKYNLSRNKEDKTTNKLDESVNRLNEIINDRDARINALAPNHPSYARQQQLKQDIQQLDQQIATAPDEDQYWQNTYLFYNTIFNALQHPTPHQNTQIQPPSDAFYDPINGNYSHTYSGNTEQLIINVIRSTISMFPNTSFWNSNLSTLDFTDAHLDPTHPDREAYHRTKGTMSIMPQTSISTYAHETMHFLQDLFGENLFYTHRPWITNRIENEELQPLKSLRPRNKYGVDEFAYKDSVDDPYTLKSYDANENYVPTTESIIRNGDFTQFGEIHSMAFTRLHELYKRTDHQLFMQTLFSMFMLSSDDEVVKSFRGLFDGVIKLHQ
jgi:hypothetical protein